MKRIKKIINSTPILIILCILLIFTVINYTVARKTNTSELSTNNVKVAKFHVAFDGLESNSITCKILATSKITDITLNNNIYYGNSFIEGAYKAYPVVIASDSDVKTTLNLKVSTVNNDDRLFYVILPDCSTEQDIYKVFYDEFNGQNPTLSDIRDFCDKYNNKTYTFDYEEERRFTFIVWSEHDAVYIDSNNDGIVNASDLVFGDTNKDGVINTIDSPPSTTFLSDLVDGIPSDTYTIDYTVIQKD